MADKPSKPADRPASPRFKQRKKSATATSEQVPTLRALTRMRPSHQEWDDSWKEMREGTARSAAIIASAFTEDALRFAILDRCVLLEPPDIDRLLEPPGPMSSFYGKIELGFALGLYGPMVHDDLHTVRAIRNGFAHAMQPLSFETVQVVDELKKLKYLDYAVANATPVGELHTPSPQDLIASGHIPIKTNRDKFVYTCQTISYSLMRVTQVLLSAYLQRAPRLP